MKSTACPIADTMRSAGNVLLGAFDDLDLELRADELRLALRDPQRDAAAVSVLDHADRRQPAADRDAFRLRLLDLVLVRLHLVDVEHRRQRDLGALLRRHRRHVVGHVAGDRELREVGRLRRARCGPSRRATVATSIDVSPPPMTTTRLPTWCSRPSLNAFRNDVAVTTFGASPPGAGSGRPDCAPMPRNTASKSSRIDVQRHVGADPALQVRLDAHVDDALDLGVQHLARRAEARDAVAHHPAQMLVLVEYRDLMAAARELVRTRQPRRSAADHRDLLAAVGGHGSEGELVGDRVLAEEVLDRIDADVVLDLVAIAAGFARRRAYAAHHRRERIGVGQPAPRIFLPVHARGRLLDAAHDVEIAADVLARRAAALARRRRLDVGRALVRIARLEDLVAPGVPLRFRRPCSGGT